MNDTKIKICSTCKISKTMDDYHRDKQTPDGFAYECKFCKKIRIKKHINKRIQENNYIMLVEKKCNICCVVKNIDEFSIQKSHPDGRGNTCKECNRGLYKDRVENLKYVEKITINEKKCGICGVIKNINEFNKNRMSNDNHDTKCKECQHHYDLSRNYNIELKKETKVKGKTCTCCKKHKDSINFSFSNKQPDGYSSWCNECMSLFYKENKQNHNHNII